MTRSNQGLYRPTKKLQNMYGYFIFMVAVRHAKMIQIIRPIITSLLMVSTPESHRLTHLIGFIYCLLFIK